MFRQPRRLFAPCPRSLASGLIVLAALAGSATAVNIQIDYTYDDNHFFDAATPDGQAARAALQAVADRYSCLIGSVPVAVAPRNPSYPGDGSWRVGFTHPSTGQPFQISTSDSAATDPLVNLSGRPAADVYDNTFSLQSSQWILYPGGSPLTGAVAEAGTGTGLNYTTVFNDPTGPLRRGIGEITSLPVWGGSATFDNDGSTNWHFDHTTAAGPGEIDFYSVALHEVGHVFGVGTGWQDFSSLVDPPSDSYSGAAANAAYQADNNTTDLLSVEDGAGGNYHWAEGAYQSFPHTACGPASHVDPNSLQDLIMEPILNLSAAAARFELTNVDVAALEDVGWAIVPEPGTGMMTWLGLGGVALACRRRRSTRRASAA